MKNKLKLNTILLALMIILVPLTSTQAWTTYTYDLFQDPYELNVRVGDIIVISIERIPDDGDDLEKVLTKGGIFGEFRTNLKFQRNDEKLVTIETDQTLPTMLNPITFTIGPFDEGDIIVYQIYLVLDDAKDYSDASSFEVLSPDVPPVPVPREQVDWVIYVLIGVGALTILLVLAYLFKKRRAS
jgi:hypothetical protein